jgi:hypothetical protein
MSDQEKYTIRIYVPPVEAQSILNGKVEYLQAKMFLNMLTERSYKPEYMPRPIPEPGQDWYELTKEQYRAYLQFLSRLKGKSPRPE